MPKNIQVFLDVSIGGRGGGRIIFELFSDVTPRTAENFRGLCTGEYGKGRTTGKRLCYEGCSFFRSVKGFVIQSGDFQFNNGDGGESVYGGTFNDEDNTRRHTQAGVLSMANKGRNSNGSQFFVTLKRATQLDRKHVAFGQVVAGMDVIRAIAAVPADKDEKPRVPIIIVGSGQVDQKTRTKDLSDVMAQQIADLNEEVAPTGIKVPESVKAKSILAGRQGGAAVDEEAEIRSSRKTVEEEAEEGGAGTRPARNERERKLFELRLRMNQSRNMNNKEVVEEQKREADPDYARKKGEERTKAALAKEAKEAGEAGEGSANAVGAGKEDKGLPKGKRYLDDTVEFCDAKDAKKKKGNPDAFGWDVFNQDSLYRAHEKRIKHMVHDDKAYAEQAEQELREQPFIPGFGFSDTEHGKDRLQKALDKMEENKGKYSRRRTNLDDHGDATAINERNKHFNKKIQRAFGAYTEECRQNLERGTAL